jgi:hypothetical protein
MAARNEEAISPVLLRTFTRPKHEKRKPRKKKTEPLAVHAYLVPQRDVDTVAVRKPSLKKEGDGGEEEEG